MTLREELFYPSWKVQHRTPYTVHRTQSYSTAHTTHLYSTVHRSKSYSTVAQSTRTLTHPLNAASHITRPPSHCPLLQRNTIVLWTSTIVLICVLLLIAEIDGMTALDNHFTEVQHSTQYKV